MSNLGRYAHLMRDPSPANAKAAAERAWREQGLLVIDPERYKDSWLLQREIINLGDRLYGKRKAK